MFLVTWLTSIDSVSFSVRMGTLSGIASITPMNMIAIVAHSFCIVWFMNMRALCDFLGLSMVSLWVRIIWTCLLVPLLILKLGLILRKLDAILVKRVCPKLILTRLCWSNIHTMLLWSLIYFSEVTLVTEQYRPAVRLEIEDRCLKRMLLVWIATLSIYLFHLVILWFII